jgi:hypothetical protein
MYAADAGDDASEIAASSAAAARTRRVDSFR